MSTWAARRIGAALVAALLVAGGCGSRSNAPELVAVCNNAGQPAYLLGLSIAAAAGTKPSAAAEFVDEAGRFSDQLHGAADATGEAELRTAARTIGAAQHSGGVDGFADVMVALHEVCERHGLEPGGGNAS